MHQRKRNLTGNRVRERLSIKKWTDKHRHRIVYERSRHPKYHKIRASRFAVEKVVVCGDAKEAVRECGYPCPRAPLNQPKSLPRKPLSSSDTLVVSGTTGISGEWKFTLSAVR